MIGTIVGDIVGSIYEFDDIKTKTFELFDKDCTFTDDTVMTIAVAKALNLWNRDGDIERFKNILIDVMHDYGNRYPDCGFGGRFLTWILQKRRKPYNSYGNGSAMRVSSVAWFANSLEEVKLLAKATAEITHNHAEGIKGAVSTAVAIYFARIGKSKEEIKKHITENYYKIDFTLDSIRQSYEFDESCQGSVPEAIQAFFESDSFEDCIRNAISIGGDSDTIAAIAGSIAEAYYGIDEDIEGTALSFLDDFLLDELWLIRSSSKVSF